MAAVLVHAVNARTSIFTWATAAFVHVLNKIGYQIKHCRCNVKLSPLLLLHPSNPIQSYTTIEQTALPTRSNTMICFFSRGRRLIQMMSKCANAIWTYTRPELLDINFGTASDGTNCAQGSHNLCGLVV